MFWARWISFKASLLICSEILLTKLLKRLNLLGRLELLFWRKYRVVNLVCRDPFFLNWNNNCCSTGGWNIWNQRFVEENKILHRRLFWNITWVLILLIKESFTTFGPFVFFKMELYSWKHVVVLRMFDIYSELKLLSCRFFRVILPLWCFSP